MRHDPKPRPNHEAYLEALRRMTPGERMMKVFELNDFVREMFMAGLRHSYPNATEEELRQIFIKQSDKWHNQNY